MKDETALTVGVAYNLKRGATAGPPDAEAEFDDFETISVIKKALETVGHRVELFEAEEGFTAAIAANKPDIVFNIAEGRIGRGREAHVPAILSFLGIPYTGADETAMCLAMDKALTKRILASYGITTPQYCVISNDISRVADSGGGFHIGGSSSCTSCFSEPCSSPDDNALTRCNGCEGEKSRSAADIPAHFPLPAIVKPVAEGSGKGISGVSIVASTSELYKAANDVIKSYAQDALVEEYIDGREFTVGLLGNGNDVRIFAPMEIIFRDADRRIYSYDIKRNFKQHVDYACPPNVGVDVISALKETALRIFRIIGCRDFARVDFRMSHDGDIYFLELNPIPGLAPGYSDYPMLAEFCGVGYDELICRVLDCALARYGL